MKPLAPFFWLLDFLFNPPPLEAMSSWQRGTRVLLITSALIVTCIHVAIVGAALIYVVERGRRMLAEAPELNAGLAILGLSLLVNVVCVSALLHIRRADRRLLGQD